MNKLIATLLASVAGATIATAPAAAQNKTDSAGYRTAMQKIEADHKAAKQKCDALKDEDVCEEQADVARARAELAAVTKYDNTPSNLEAARRKLADAEYELAEEKCDLLKGNEKDSCQNNAKSVRTAALADAKAGRDGAAATTGGTGTTAATAGSAGLIASTDTKDPVKAAAVQKCEEKGSKTACLVENKGTADTALERAGEKTRAAAATAVDKTKEAARNVADKTKQLTAGAAARTEHAADKTERATERAGSKTATAMSDSAITAKVKAGLAAEPDLSALAIKVETEKGVVSLSGFVESKAEAERAEKLAKGVEGVTRVKSAIKVK
jgi:osmotically-inducible protein OsmY